MNLFGTEFYFVRNGSQEKKKRSEAWCSIHFQKMKSYDPTSDLSGFTYGSFPKANVLSKSNKVLSKASWSVFLSFCLSNLLVCDLKDPVWHPGACLATLSWQTLSAIVAAGDWGLILGRGPILSSLHSATASEQEQCTLATVGIQHKVIFSCRWNLLVSWLMDRAK